MPQTTVAAIQMTCVADPAQNLPTPRAGPAGCGQGRADRPAARAVRTPVFLQERRYEYYDYALPLEENPAVRPLCRGLPRAGAGHAGPAFMKRRHRLFNSAAMLDADGSILGVYRKTHIRTTIIIRKSSISPPATPVSKCLIPSTAGRGGHLLGPVVPGDGPLSGAGRGDLILYPTAIGSEPILDVDSAGHWQRTMQGHAAANVLPVVAANRYGTEVVTPCRENGGQQSALRFYGTSFLTDETGAVLVQAGGRGRRPDRKL